MIVSVSGCCMVMTDLARPGSMLLAENPRTPRRFALLLSVILDLFSCSYNFVHAIVQILKWSVLRHFRHLL